MTTAPPPAVDHPDIATFIGPDGAQTVTLPPLPPCPTWCVLPANHGWDTLDRDGRLARGHAAKNEPDASFSLGAQEYSNGTIERDVYFDEPPLTAHYLRLLATEAAQAAAWLESGEVPA